MTKKSKIAFNIFKAIRHNQVDVIRKILNQNEISIEHLILKSNFNVLDYAVAQNNVTAFNLILAKLIQDNESLKEKNTDSISNYLALLQNKHTGKTPWHLAAELAYSDFFNVKSLAHENYLWMQEDERIQVYHLKDKQGRTPLHHAAYYKENLSEDRVREKKLIIHTLLSLPASNPNIVDEYGETALHLASKNGCVITVKALLKYADFKYKKSLPMNSKQLELNVGMKQARLLANSHTLIQLKMSALGKKALGKSAKETQFSVLDGLSTALQAAVSVDDMLMQLKHLTHFELIANPDEILQSNLNLNLSPAEQQEQKIQHKKIIKAYQALAIAFKDIDNYFVFENNTETNELKKIMKEQAFINEFVKLHLEMKREQLWWDHFKSAVVSSLCPASTIATAIGSFGGLKLEPISTLIIALPIFLILAVPFTVAKFKSKRREYDEVVGETIHFEWLNTKMLTYQKKFTHELKNIKTQTQEIKALIDTTSDPDKLANAKQALHRRKNEFTQVQQSMHSVLEFKEKQKPKIKLQHIERHSLRERQWAGRLDPAKSESWTLTNDKNISTANYSSEVLCAVGGVLTLGAIGTAVLSQTGVITGIFAAGFLGGPIGIVAASAIATLFVVGVIGYTIYKASYQAEQKAAGERNRSLVAAHEKCKNGTNFGKIQRLSNETQKELNAAEQKLALAMRDQKSPGPNEVAAADLKVISNDNVMVGEQKSNQRNSR